MTLRDRLRQETAKEHQSIEGAFPVFQEDFSKDKYTQLLKKLHGFYQPLESQFPALDNQGHSALNLPERSRLNRIKKDLTYQGVGEEAQKDISISPVVPKISNLSHLAGALYVVEGSSLGGQLITKELRKKFGESEPANYFNCYGSQTGMQWQSFLSWLNEAETKVNAEEVIATAKETFRSLNAWLKSSSPEVTRPE